MSFHVTLAFQCNFVMWNDTCRYSRNMDPYSLKKPVRDNESSLNCTSSATFQSLEPCTLPPTISWVTVRITKRVEADIVLSLEDMHHCLSCKSRSYQYWSFVKKLQRNWMHPTTNVTHFHCCCCLAWEFLMLGNIAKKEAQGSAGVGWRVRWIKNTWWK